MFVKGTTVVPVAKFTRLCLSTSKNTGKSLRCLLDLPFIKPPPPEASCMGTRQNIRFFSGTENVEVHVRNVDETGTGTGSGNKGRYHSDTSPSRTSVYSNTSEYRGKEKLDRSLRSVLSHPLCLPLMYYMYEIKPNELLPFDFRVHKRNIIEIVKDKFENVLINAWNTSFEEKQKVMETTLTKTIAELVNNITIDLPFHASPEVKIELDEKNGGTTKSGKVDIMLECKGAASNSTSSEREIPLMICEFGMNHQDWWHKFDQCTQYAEILYKQNIRTEIPLLMLVMTCDRSSSIGTDTKHKSDTSTVNTKTGLFFCCPQWGKDDLLGLRISLLWNWNSDTLAKGSRQFGRIFEVAAFFHSLKNDLESMYFKYEYFSSNCCKIEDKVYRIYDNRYRDTHRSYNAYVADNLQDILGKCTQVLKLSNCALPTMDGKGEKELTVIATPYRRGTHTSAMPTAFLPIIDQLIVLHSNNYVHGDIRAYNMVFGHDHKQGWLIDFDFAGLCGTATYPPNYREDVGDGIRLGEPEDIITKYHDWYALFSVIFFVHKLNRNNMKNRGDFADRVMNMQDCFTEVPINGNIPSDVVNELKKLLQDFQEAGGRFTPSERFSKLLTKCGVNMLNTNHKGTGSPTMK